MPSTGVKAARAEATRQALIRAGRLVFARDGYASAIADEIVRSAGVTRGALYHHFGGKHGLFRAVVEDTERTLMASVQQASPPSADPWETFRYACQAFLDACLDPMVQRIVLIDGPAVLTPQEWRDITEAYSLAALRQAIGAGARTRPHLRGQVEGLADLLQGALHAAAVGVARADDPSRARKERGEAVDLLLRGLGNPTRASD